MTLLDSAAPVMRVGSQRPRPGHFHLPPAVSSAGREAIDLAASAGLILDDWQRWVLLGMLGETAAGKWAAFEACLIVPRQNGKNAILEALELAGLFLFDERIIVHSAHRFDTCTEHFLRMQELIDGNPDFSKKLARNGIVTANGKEAIKLASGQRLKFAARQRGSGRGFTGNRIVFDEAFDLPTKAMGSMIPALAAKSVHEDVQVVYTSSAPHADSVVLHGLRKRGVSTDPGPLFFAEWGRGTDECFDEDDRDAWYEDNPALGMRITEDFVAKEKRSLEVAPGEFARERLGVVEPLPDDTADRPAKIPADAWPLTITAPTMAGPGQVTLAFGVSRDGEWTALAIGAGDLSDPYVELIEHKPGTGWLPTRLVELIRRWEPYAVGYNGIGATGSIVGPVMLALMQAGISAELLHPLGATEYRNACGGFFLDVTEVPEGATRPRLRRPDGMGPLDNAVADAAERRVGAGGFVWDERSATVPIVALEVVTVARALLSVEPPKKRSGVVV